MPNSARGDILSSQFVRSALESSPDAMVIIDPAGGILFANKQVQPVFGYGPEELVGQPVEILMPENHRAQHIAHRTRFGASPRVRPMGVGLELIARHQDGHEFPVEISLSPVRDGDEDLVVAAIRDVTDRKRAQRELIAAREAADRARQVADFAREAADRANQAKSRFLATASHDLRQPLQSLALLNGALRRVINTSDALEALAHQDQAIGSMSRLLNALLDISKLESGAIRPEPVDFNLENLFGELSPEFAALAAAKGLQFHVESSTDRAHSDPALVAQILRNLLSNAVKYTSTGSVRLRVLRQFPGVRIEVIDTGVGIPQDQLPRIYDEFYQVGVGLHSSRDGYGLGLSIVRRLAGLLGIRLDVQSQVGSGSVFAIELPAGRSQFGSGPAARAVRSDGTGPALATRVLLVEDDPAVRDATRMLLKVEGYRVVATSCLAQAEESARQHQDIELLVTDFHLSDGETGSQVISSLRQILGADLKAVLITGDTTAAVKNVQPDRRLRVARKPIAADQLLAMLKELLAA